MPASVPLSLLCVGGGWICDIHFESRLCSACLQAILRSLQVSDFLSIDEQDRAHSGIGIALAVILEWHHSHGLPEVRSFHCDYSEEIKSALDIPTL